METLHGESAPTHDANAQLDGFLEVKSMKFYDVGEQPPTEHPMYPEPPCLVHEVFDEELSAETKVKLLKPVAWVKLNQKQTEFIRRYFR